MNLKNFEDVIIDKTGGNKKFKTDEYLVKGILPIIDQGKEFIAGYTNEKEVQVSVKLPCIVFGDHTKIFKYVDFSFALGADGTKVLETVNGADAKYLYYYFSRTKLPGKDGYNRNYKYLKEIKIPLPDLKTQLEIALVLEQADKARQQRKAANALTDQFLQSSFLSLFGDPVKNEKEWEKAELKNLIGSIDSGWSPVCDENPRTNEDQWAFLKLGAVTYCEFDPLENKKMLDGISPKESIEVKKDDLLFTRKNTKDLVAATAYVFDTPKRLQMSDTIFRLKYIEEKVSGIFLWHLLLDKNFRKEVQSLATGSSGSMPNISKEKLMKLSIPLPPLSLQQQFAGIVAQAEQLRQKQRESGMELENLFQGLLQRYFG